MHSQVIVISGCSSGIGYAAARFLKDRGHQVFVSARRYADLENLQKEGFNAVLMDMDDTHSIANAIEQILLQTLGRLDVLINNAGFGQGGALEDITRDTLREQFETNVFGLMDLTRHVIPVMRQQGSGRIINISSILGLVSMPFRGAYNASKYAVEGLSDTLRLELKASGIKVITVNPGPIESMFRRNVMSNSLKKVLIEESHFAPRYQHMRQFFEEQKSQSFFTCNTNVVNKKLRHAIESSHPKARYYVTFAAYALAFTKRLFSTKMLDRVLTRLSAKELGHSATDTNKIN